MGIAKEARCVGLAFLMGWLFVHGDALWGQQQETQSTGETATSTSTASSRIDESQLVGLPLQGRSYTQLATLEAGVSDTSATAASRGIGGGGLNVAGGRNTSNIFLLDGTNIMTLGNIVPRSAAGVQLGSDAVLQVQVFSTTYSAEYGRGSGGILNTITRSGTPEFHGTLFEYFRNSKLDARNFFDPGEPPPFKRNQIGFTFTGPIRKERTFFMGSFEAMRDRLTDTDVSFFPDREARQGIITDRDGIVTRTIERVNPDVIPYLNLMPIPNGDRVGGGVGENRAARFLPTDENFFTVRLDHEISQRDSLFARYTFSDATSNSPADSFLFKRFAESRQQYLTLVASHIFSSRTLTSFRFGYTRPTSRADTFSSIEIPESLFFVQGGPRFGRIEIPSLTTLGTFTTLPEVNIVNTFQFADDVVAQRGSHALKFGAQLHRYRWFTFSSRNFGGLWSFNSLESFLDGGPEGGRGTSVSVALPGSSSKVDFRQTLAGFYIQDEYRVTPRLLLSLGLRYEFITRVREKDGRSQFLVDPLRDPEIQVGHYIASNPSPRYPVPRVGLSWSPWGHRDTVIRGGFGLFNDQIVEYLVDRPKTSVPWFLLAEKPNLGSEEFLRSFPNILEVATGASASARVMDYEHITTPRVMRYNFAVQDELPGGWRVQASYVGARGIHLFRSYGVNKFPFPEVREDGSLFFPPDPNLTPINPAFRNIEVTSSDSQSFYNSLQLAARKTVGQGLSLRASYSFGKSVDDASRLSPNAQYGFDRTLERGLSSSNIRHRLVFNYFYTLPFGSGQRWWNSGIASRIFRGWRLGGILRFRTGTPFNPQVSVRYPDFLFEPTRPNLKAGQDLSNITEGVTAGCGFDPETGRFVVEPGQMLGTRELYFDPCVFEVPPPGTMGNVGRNTLTGPSVFNMDLSISREFAVDSKRRLQFRAEIFNLPNHTNFGRRSSLVFRGTGRRNLSAGRITSTSTTSRQIQFALRLSF